MLRARGVKVAFLAYTQMTNGIPLPHPWSVNLASAGRILRDARRARRAGARVVIVNLHWGTEFQPRAGRLPDLARTAAGPLARDHRRGRPARSRGAADPAGRPDVGRVRHRQPALEPDRGVLPGRHPGRHARAAASARRPEAGPRRARHVRADVGAASRLHDPARRPPRRVVAANGVRGRAEPARQAAALRSARSTVSTKARDHRGVELRPRAAAQLVERLRVRQRRAVGAVGDHGVVGVADGDDAGAERDVVAGEAVGVAGAVEALVRGADERRRSRRGRARPA